MKNLFSVLWTYKMKLTNANQFHEKDGRFIKERCGVIKLLNAENVFWMSVEEKKVCEEWTRELESSIVSMEWLSSFRFIPMQLKLFKRFDECVFIWTF